MAYKCTKILGGSSVKIDRMLQPGQSLDEKPRRGIRYVKIVPIKALVIRLFCTVQFIVIVTCSMSEVKLKVSKLL